MDTDPHDEFYARLDATARGEASNLIAEMRSGYAVLGDTQHLPGYCLLLYRRRVEHRHIPACLSTTPMMLAATATMRASGIDRRFLDALEFTVIPIRSAPKIVGTSHEGPG